MVARHLFQVAFDQSIGRQMRFIAGPRQSGKTTLAKEQLKAQHCEACYFNWDLRGVRSLYRDNPSFYWESCYSLGTRKEKYWVCFDEIHKMPKWKNILKGAFDANESKIQFIATGSARLDWFRKSGDSLVGRYFLFHLLPVTLRELEGSQLPDPPPKEAATFIERQLGAAKENYSAFETLLRFSGFPEPLTKQSDNFHRKWRETYTDQLVREDLRDITHIRELENIAALSQFLPQRVGSPLSVNSLREDLEVSYNAVKNYLKALELAYVIFSVSPYVNKIKRSVKKEKKVYFYDWTKIKDPSTRFENYVGAELQALTMLWNDAGYGSFALYYVRNKEGKETDFLITYEQKPWLLIEVKVSRGLVDSHHLRHAKELGDIPFIQIVAQKEVAQKHGANVWILSAHRFFK